DERQAGHAIKGMRAAIRIRRFRHWEPEVLHDEGTVLGFQPAGESAESTVSPSEASRLFEIWAADLQSRVELLNPEESGADTILLAEEKPIVSSYRPRTAFIMMWMTKGRP